MLKFSCAKEQAQKTLRVVIDLTNKIKDDSVDFLFKSILQLETVDECYDFFEDLCTVPEIKAMSQRIVVAHMLKKKRVYSDIVSRTGASTATISRVNRSLNYGEGGYDMVFGRMTPEELYIKSIEEDGGKKE